MGRRKTNNPPSPPNNAPLPYQIADPSADVEALRWKIHSYIDGMDEYMLRMVWSFLTVFYPNDPDSHCRR